MSYLGRTAPGRGPRMTEPGHVDSGAGSGSLVELLSHVPEQFHDDVLHALSIAAQDFARTGDRAALERFQDNMIMTLGLLARPDFVKAYEDAHENPPVASTIGVDGWVERIRERVG